MRDTIDRRRSLLKGLALIGGAAALGHGHDLRAAVTSARSLAFEHLHTGERLSVRYALDGQYVPAALQRVNHFLRDHYSGQIGNIDPLLLDQLHAIRATLGCDAPLHVVSAYRCPTTNQMLRKRGGGGVAATSLHLQGKAIDIRIPGVALNDLRDAALSLRSGGVGSYPSSNFVHVDTGRLRRW